MTTSDSPQQPRTKKELETLLHRRLNDNIGEVQLAWQIREFEQPQRTIIWYVVAGLITAALFIYAIMADNFLFAVMIVVIAFIVTVQSLRKPDTLTVAITTKGIALEDKFYSYDTLNAFWLLYEPPHVKDVGITFLSSWRPDLLIPLERTNPLHVRKMLSQYLVEEEREETFSSVISRIFRL